MTASGDRRRERASSGARSRADAGSRGARHRAQRRARRLRLLVLVAVTGAAVVAAVVVLWPHGPDPFPGVYWDPGSGRRVEITHDGGGYEFLYGVARRGYAAERHGDELRVRDPFSGYLVVRSTDSGLVLVQGGRETKLEALPSD